MPLPAKISDVYIHAGAYKAESGPYVYNNRLFGVFVNRGGTTIDVFSSVCPDRGGTWAVNDDSNSPSSPSSGALDPEKMASCVDCDTIHVVYQDGSAAAEIIKYAPFSMKTRTWGTVVTSTETMIAGASPMVGYPTLVRIPEGPLRIFYPGPQTSSAQNCYYIDYDISAGTFGTSQRVNVTTGSSPINYVARNLILGSGGLTHAIYSKVNSTSFAQEILHRSIDGTGGFGTEQTITTTGTAPGLGASTCWEGTAVKVAFPYISEYIGTASDRHYFNVAIADSAVNPSWSIETTGTNIVVDPISGAASEPVPGQDKSLAWRYGELHLAVNGAPASDLPFSATEIDVYHAIRDINGTWGSATLVTGFTGYSAEGVKIRTIDNGLGMFYQPNAGTDPNFRRDPYYVEVPYSPSCTIDPGGNYAYLS